MCFTFAGRLQTRLMALIGPLLLAGVYTAVSRDPVYLTMFSLMAVLGVALDVGAYNWLIGYQPRWLTFALGAVEFGLLVFVGQGFIDLGRMAGFFFPAWVVSWLTLEVALPLAWPRWSEDGGELRLRGEQPAPDARVPDAVFERRRLFAASAAVLMIGGLPWIAGSRFAPEGYHFTGVLTWPDAHLAAFSQVLSAMRGSAIVPFDAHLSRTLAEDALWFTASLAWLFGVRKRVGPESPLPWPKAAVLAPLLMPAPFVAVLAGAIWLLPAMPWRRLFRPFALKLAAALIALALAWKIVSGALPLYHGLLIAAVLMWLTGARMRAQTVLPVAWWAILLVSPLALPEASIALLTLTVWTFLPVSQHWLVRSVVPSLALAVYFVWSAVRVGAIDAVAIVQICWIVASFAWLMGVAVLTRESTSLRGIVAASLAPLILPFPFIVLLAIGVWLVRTPLRLPFMRQAVQALSLLALITWGQTWAQFGAMRQTASPPAYLDADHWAVSRWLWEATDSGAVTPILTEADRLAALLSGRQIAPDTAQARFWLATGDECKSADVRLQQGAACLIEPAAP